ncbi:MAG: chorismate synthase [Nitrososphaerota archaeon]|nr:chorismate synthase [Nitrososphaerota archaeon]MDG6943192.1 chorismate synthase [Nitrososphaerota archaeon]MDG6950930.1 chorismate synthase [Nitrososphaerota archaeon]
MSGNIIGERFLLVTFGESHGKVVGAVLDGCPAGLALKEEDVQVELDLRKPGQSIVTTQRKEDDRVEIMSGVFNGRTTGAPIMMLIRNSDKDSKSYDAMVNSPRPGHADLVAKMKYGGFNDYRGGGRFSGRITASFVMGGAVAKKLLREVLGVEIIAYSLEIGGVRAEGFDLETARRNRYENEARAPTTEAADKMKRKIIEARGGGNSLGGIVECIALNVPAGLGEPVFASLDSELARMALSIPAVKGVEFGSGFASTRLRGTENNDEYYYQGDVIKTKTNNAGGILGGLSTGMPVVYRIAFKPASSIASKQTTVDLAAKKEVGLIVPGRHDPTVVPRAIPVVENATALVLADHAIRAGLIPQVLRGR